jgi:cytochrome P450
VAPELTSAVAPDVPLLWRPPAPVPITRRPGRLEALRLLRQDLLSIWSEEALTITVGDWRFFGSRTVLVNDPALIRQVLVEHESRYRRSVMAQRLLEPVVGNGLLLAEGAVWQRQRRTLAPAFTPRAVHGLLPHFLAATSDMLDGLPRSGPVDLLKICEHLALDIAARSLFSTRLGPLIQDFASIVAESQQRIGQPIFTDYLAQSGLGFIPNWSRFGFRRRWHRMIARFIADRRRTETTGDVLDLLIKARDPETGEGFSEREIVDQVGTMLAAGFETTAMALFWTFFLLGCQPDAQERARQEVLAGDLSDDQADKAVAGMPWLQAVIQESLRLYPPAHAISRVAAEPDRLGGLQVEPGDTVMISPYVLHRHRLLWQNPECFDPSRFLPGSPEAGRPMTWLPFGGGPRICIGMAFARCEMAVIVAKVLRRYRFSISNPESVRPVGKITIIPVGNTTALVERLD